VEGNKDVAVPPTAWQIETGVSRGQGRNWVLRFVLGVAHCFRAQLESLDEKSYKFVLPYLVNYVLDRIRNHTYLGNIPKAIDS
jgi:hypothetical protein